MLMIPLKIGFCFFISIQLQIQVQKHDDEYVLFK